MAENLANKRAIGNEKAIVNKHVITNNRVIASKHAIAKKTYDAEYIIYAGVLLNENSLKIPL